MTANHLGAGTEIVFVLLERRILDGKPGVQGEATSPVSVFHRAERNKAAICYPCATNTRNNKNPLNRQIWEGITGVAHPRNLATSILL